MKSLALIAHDGKKADLVAFATYNRAALAQFQLVATATTGRLLREKVGLDVETVLSGPQGGDTQIAALAAEGRVGAVLFFVGPSALIPMTPTSRPSCASATCTTCRLPRNVAAADLFLGASLQDVEPRSATLSEV